MFIEGYFSVFGAIYKLWEGATESIARGAFSETLEEDIRALINHETRLVLGRNKSGTLGLKEDNCGLWAEIRINQNDTDATNLYSRVQRGDVDQCSFGFDILDENVEYRKDGTVHWEIRKVKLYEISVVTFPAYQDTSVSARKQDLKEIKQRELEAWKLSTKKRLEEHDGTKSINA